MTAAKPLLAKLAGAVAVGVAAGVVFTLGHPVAALVMILAGATSFDVLDRVRRRRGGTGGGHR